MDSDFKKFFSSTLGIAAAVGLVVIVLCLCCLILAAIGQNMEPTPTPAVWTSPVELVNS